MSRLDLLVFGPHPDDLEIGLGGTLAKHAALGHAVGLCDLTRGEMSSNGTPDERVREAEAARAVLGAAWRENLALPDRAHRELAGASRARSSNSFVASRPRAIAVPVLAGPPSRSLSRQRRCCARRCSTPGSRRYAAAGEPWQPEWVCHYFINDAAPASFVVDVSEHYETKRRALACYASQFARATGCGGNASELAALRAAHRKPRRAVWRAAGVAFAEGIVVREPVRPRTPA